MKRKKPSPRKTTARRTRTVSKQIPTPTARQAAASRDSAQVAAGVRSGNATDAQDELFKTLFVSAPIAMVLTDVHRRILRANQALCDLIGYKEQELLGQTYELYTHPDDLEPNRTLNREFLAGSRTSYTVEKRYICKDGHLVWVVVSARAMAIPGQEQPGIFAVITDITERKRAEEELRESSERLRPALEAGRAGTWRVDLRTGADTRDAALNVLLGLPAVSSTQPVEDWFSYAHPDDLLGIQAAWTKGLVDGVYDMEHRMVRRDGSMFWVHDRGRIVRDDQGQALYAIGAAVDITERKQAETLLQIAQAKLRQALQASNTGLWDWNTETNEVEFSPEWKRQLGYEEHEIAGCFEEWESRLHPEDRERTLAYVSAYLKKAEGEYSQEFRLRHKDGSYRWIAARAAFVTEADDRRVRLLGSHMDVTERKQIEDELRTSQQRLQAVLERTSDAVFIKDEQGRYLLVNAATTAYVGKSPEEIIGHDDTFLFSPDDAKTLMEKDHSAMIGGRTITYEDHVTTADGVPRTFLSTKGPLFDAQGNVTGLFGISRDITERKQVEEAANQVMRRYKDLVDSVKGIVWEVDASTMQFTFVSQQAVAILGYPIERWLSDPLFWADHIHPEDRHWAVQYCLEETRQQHGHTFEYRMLAADGRIVWIRDLVTLVIENGRVVKLRGIMEDITERKQVETLLKDERNRLSIILDTVGDPIFVKDNDHRILLANRAFYDMFKMDTDAVIGKTLAESVPEDERVHFLTVDRHVLDTGEPDLREETLTVGGFTRRIITKKTRFLEDSGQKFMVGSIHDITELKQAEARLQTTQYAVDHAADQIFLIGSDGYFMDVNESACRCLGYTKQELLTMTVMDIDPDFPSYAWTTFWEKLRASKFVRLEARHRAKSGEVYSVEIAANYLLHDGQEFDCAIVRDITDRQRLEERLRQAEKMEAIGRLAGGIAHDFNNVLTVINGYSERLLLNAQMTPPLAEQIEAIHQAGERAAGLTRQLLAYSRQQVLSPKVLSLNEVVRAVEPLLQRLIGEHVELVLHLGPSLGAIEADPGQIEQIIMNLVLNARDAMPQGGRVIIATAERIFGQDDAGESHGLPPGAYATLTVTDTGTGMAQATAARVFEPFFTTKVVGQGTGLGLATVYGVATQSGGAVWVDSAPGEGATFTVCLPRVDTVQPALPAPAAASRSRRGSETILLVEDEPSVRELVGEILREEGYQVLTASSGAEALPLAHSHAGPIHLLLTDVVMPHMNGVELARQLTAHRPGVKVLFMSGYTNDPLVEQYLAAPHTSFMSKPLQIGGLAEKVRALLDAVP